MDVVVFPFVDVKSLQQMPADCGLRGMLADQSIQGPLIIGDEYRTRLGSLLDGPISDAPNLAIHAVSNMGSETQ